MIDPKTFSENLMFNTIRIEIADPPGGTGTGFIFVFSIGSDQKVPVIITNKHVLQSKNNPKVKFSLHTIKDGKPVDFYEVEFKTEWYFHPNQDLCFCFLQPLLNEIKNRENKNVFYKSITEDLIRTSSQLEELNAIEEVIMVGYPKGLWDKKNNLPLFRKGITSSHPAVDFNINGVGAVDMACFEGSSGSPIFILNESGYGDKQGSLVMGKRFIFLGVLFSGPLATLKGELIVEPLTTPKATHKQQKIIPVTPTLINLGYYIKAKEILYFKPEIEALIK